MPTLHFHPLAIDLAAFFALDENQFIAYLQGTYGSRIRGGAYAQFPKHPGLSPALQRAVHKVHPFTTAAQGSTFTRGAMSIVSVRKEIINCPSFEAFLKMTPGGSAPFPVPPGFSSAENPPPNPVEGASAPSADDADSGDAGVDGEAGEAGLDTAGARRDTHDGVSLPVATVDEVHRYHTMAVFAKGLEGFYYGNPRNPYMYRYPSSNGSTQPRLPTTARGRLASNKGPSASMVFACAITGGHGSTVRAYHTTA